MGCTTGCVSWVAPSNRTYRGVGGKRGVADHGACLDEQFTSGVVDGSNHWAIKHNGSIVCV